MSDKVEVYVDLAGEWRWRRKSRNGAVLADSAEGYKNKAHALKMAARCNVDCRIVEVS